MLSMIAGAKCQNMCARWCERPVVIITDFKKLMNALPGLGRQSDLWTDVVVGC